MISVIVDVQWGDNGKARLADYLMKDYDVCVKTNGGPNSGGRVVIKDKSYKLHNIPASILHNKPSYIARTCLINPIKLLHEIEDLTKNGFDLSNLKIDPYCHVILQKHIDRDILNEKDGGIGTTKQGIGPCSVSKFSRQGMRLFEWDCGKNIFNKYFVDISSEINNLHKNEKNILLQTSQGTMLDPDWGNYPYVSTTSNTAAAAAMGVGIAPYLVQKVIGILKPYTTMVSNQPFPLEIKDQKLNDLIVERGCEMGTTTGRRRRVGWLSLPLLQYACQVNGVTELAITKGDVLEGLSIQMDQRLLEDFASEDPLWRETYQPKLSNTFDCCSSGFNYTSFVNHFNEMGFMSGKFPQIKYISTGPERDQMELR